jgi:hypothetical protein
VSRWLLLWLAVSIAGCSAGRDPKKTRVSAGCDGPLRFGYYTLDGAALSSRSTLGRPLAMLFVTTFDLTSQVVAKRLDGQFRRNADWLSAAAIVLEDPNNAVLAAAFRSALGLSYPIAMADAATRRGESDFGEVDAVPALVLLDARGCRRFFKMGLIDERELERALTRIAPR